MRGGEFQTGLFPLVFDSSSLINIKNLGGMNKLRARRGDVLIPEKVAGELTDPKVHRNDPLLKFVLNYPGTVIPFQSNEEIEYLTIRSQSGIHNGEAAAITLALSRQLPLVIDDPRAKAKAVNHNVKVFGSNEFLS